MTTKRQLGKWCQFHFETATFNVPGIYITNTGTLRSLFKNKDECKMKDVDESTGHVFVDYIMSHTYEVDYESAEQDEVMALREYKIALKAWAIGRKYNISGLGFVAREHAVKLAELIHPVWALVATVDTPLVMKHIPGIIHRIDDYTEDVLQILTRRQATDILSRMQPPETVGWLWVLLQVMKKAQGPALERGWHMVDQNLPTLVRGLTEYLEFLHELRREREHMDPEDDEFVQYFQTLFDYLIPDAKIKCGKVMRAMVGSFNSSQKIATRKKEKPPERDKCIFTIRSISSDHLEDDKSTTILLQA
ncbi:hypothetical protein FMUND_11889 [Fusarium mundagurra]|uniref:Uncharacterized protein n=1 Tax=Fusarium mundagurra TaxID=1567541 RepID=A0A8H6D6L8_9HYPO|nr:hypothetical protein FMUND_11889 [Fusarium mundagurra]